MTPTSISGYKFAFPLARWKSVAFWTLLVALVLGFLEFSARIGLRLFRGFDGKHLYQYAYDPYKNLHPTPGFVDTRGVRHNSAGFRRSSEVTVQKPDGTYRVFLMGASTAYGLGGLWPHLQREFRVLDNRETIDAYLERMLADSIAGVKFEVINAAITSTWTHHHLIYLNQRILRYDPDMILFLDGFNDFFYFSKGHDQFASYSYSLPSQIIMGEPTIRALAYANGWWLFRKSAAAHVASRAARTLKQALTRTHRPPPLDIDSAMAGLQATFPLNALKMHRRIGLILRDEGIRAVFMLQPLLILERDRSGMEDIERRLFEFNVASYRANYEGFMHRAVKYVAAQEQATAQAVSGSFIDLTRVFRDVKGQVYTDYAHLTPLGNRVVAATIAAHIVPLIRVDLARGL
jgi:lysophospholipase L1-like esterase